MGRPLALATLLAAAAVVAAGVSFTCALLAVQRHARTGDGRPHGELARALLRRAARLGWVTFVAFALAVTLGSALWRPAVEDEELRLALRAAFPLVVSAFGIACLVAWQHASSALERGSHAPGTSAVRTTLTLAAVPFVALSIVQLGGLRGFGAPALAGLALSLLWLQVAWPRALRRLLPAAPLRDPALLEGIAALARRAGVVGVRVAAIGSVRDEPVAIAYGSRRRGGLLLSAALVERLSREEILAVAAHELAHLARRDAGRRALIAFTLLALTVAVHAGLSDAHPGARAAAVVGLGTLLAPLTLRWSERRSELAADACAARWTSPRAMAAALERLEVPVQGRRRRPRIARLLATHPTLDQRLRTLRLRGRAL